MATANWRGTVCVVKPTYGSGSLVEFIRLLPEGVGVIPVFFHWIFHFLLSSVSALP